jgi:putative metallopeptidase DUF4344
MAKPKSKWILMRTILLSAVGFLWLADANPGGESIERRFAQAHRISEPAFKTESDARLVGPKFTFVKRNSFRNSSRDHTRLIGRQAVYRIVEELKQKIDLPFELQVVFKDCGGPDSYYDDDSHEIVICDELFDAYDEIFFSKAGTRTARDEEVKGTVVAMFLHEVGHALIDGWNLPITGREEDAADQFSTLLLLHGTTGGDQMALDSARSFKLLALLEKGFEKDYSDPHSLDDQRSYETICLVYGHRPERYEHLIRNGSIPRERAFECEEHYARVNKAWETLLAPHLRR